LLPVVVLGFFWEIMEGLLLFGLGVMEVFCLGAKGGFLFGGYITVMWHESQVNVMQCCRIFHEYYPQMSL